MIIYAVRNHWEIIAILYPEISNDIEIYPLNMVYVSKVEES